MGVSAARVQKNSASEPIFLARVDVTADLRHVSSQRHRVRGRQVRWLTVSSSVLSVNLFEVPLELGVYPRINSLTLNPWEVLP